MPKIQDDADDKDRWHVHMPIMDVYVSKLMIMSTCVGLNDLMDSMLWF